METETFSINLEIEVFRPNWENPQPNVKLGPAPQDFGCTRTATVDMTETQRLFLSRNMVAIRIGDSEDWLGCLENDLPKMQAGDFGCGHYFRKPVKPKPEVAQCQHKNLEGPFCQKCGGKLLPSGVGGGSWVHAPKN